jgi:hypothetical protein
MKQGPLKKKKHEKREDNTADRRSWKKPPIDQKERRSSHRPVDAENRCEIHRTIGHDLESVELMWIIRKRKTNWWR